MSREFSLAAAALAYAVELGWAVFPLKPRDKVPLVERGFHDASTNADAIGAWWDKWPDANIGIATGEASGIVVVDVDGPEGESALEALGTIPMTPISLTGKGRHIVFARTEPVRNSAGKLGPKLDVRGDGGYIVAPPSLHPSGHRYAWEKGFHPKFVALAPLPEFVLEKLMAAPILAASVASSGNAAAIPMLSQIGNGTRNATLAEYAGRLFGKGMGELEVLRLLQGMNQTQCKPPLDSAEVEAIVASIGNAERRKRVVSLIPERPRGQFVRVNADVLASLASKNLAPIDAIPTPLPEWNDACRGFGGAQGLARGWHITIGGASGTGKSLLALNLAASALRSGRQVFYVSLEMSRDQLLSRFMAIVSRQPVRELEPGRLYSPDSWDVASEKILELAPLAIADRPSSEITEVVPLVVEAIEAGAQMVILDYVQLITARGTDGLHERTTRVSQTIQRIAFDHNVVTVALSQFNRATSFNKDAPPAVESLTGSSSLENDSDQVVLLDHSANKRFGTRMETNVLVAKNRHGPVPSIPVIWDYTTLEVKQRTPDPMDSVEKRYGI